MFIHLSVCNPRTCPQQNMDIIESDTNGYMRKGIVQTSIIVFLRSHQIKLPYNLL